MNEKALVEAKKVIAQLIESSTNQAETKNWLMELYKTLSSRFLADNNRIWSSGQIFIPVAFGAFAAFVSIKEPKWSHVLVLGLASTGLLALWALIADRHRAFQDQAAAWLTAIEEWVGLPPGGTWHAPPLSNGQIQVKELRWNLVSIVAFCWIALILWVLLSTFP